MNVFDKIDVGLRVIPKIFGGYFSFLGDILSKPMDWSFGYDSPSRDIASFILTGVMLVAMVILHLIVLVLLVFVSIFVVCLIHDGFQHYASFIVCTILSGILLYKLTKKS